MYNTPPSPQEAAEGRTVMKAPRRLALSETNPVVLDDPQHALYASPHEAKRARQKKVYRQNRQIQRFIIASSAVVLGLGLLTWAGIAAVSTVNTWITDWQTPKNEEIATPTVINAELEAQPMELSSGQASPNVLMSQWQIKSDGVPVSLFPRWRPWPASTTPLTPLAFPALSNEKQNQELQHIIDQVTFQQEPLLRPHIMVMDGQNLEWAGRRMTGNVPAASVIKLPLLYLYTMHLNAGTLQATDMVHFDERHRVSGSGGWQFQGINRYFTGYQAAEAMIQSSDNSATEVMIDILGGRTRVNEQLEAIGLDDTRIRDTLPDLNGYNTISPYEMVTLLIHLKEHPVFSDQARSVAMDILEGTHNRGLIPAFLPKNTLVAHKTGDIGKSLGESALVYLPDGRKYYLSVMVERPHNNYAAKTYIQNVSKAIWDYYSSHPDSKATYSPGVAFPAYAPAMKTAPSIGLQGEPRKKTAVENAPDASPKLDPAPTRPMTAPVVEVF